MKRVALLLALLLLAGCGGTEGRQAAAAAVDPSDWDGVLAAAEGQTVNWYMFGGDERLNAYVNGYVADRAAELGVTINQVPVGDTVEAVNKVLGEQRAGRDSDGTVDLIWINGENFRTGKQADLWYCGWSEALPNARFVDYADPAINTDFGVPISGCESAWSAAQSSLVYDSEALSEADVADLSAFLRWVEANPGRFTYPAPPDFTGSMVLRTFLYEAAGGPEPFAGEFDQAVYERYAPRLWDLLQGIEPSLWREGSTYPQTGPDVTELYANAEIDAYITYDSGTITAEVDDGRYPQSTRQAVFDGGMIANTNYVAIPYNSPNKAGAMVVTDLLIDPEAQLEKAKPDVVGYPPAIDLATTELEREFGRLRSNQAALPSDVQALPEISSSWIAELEDGWTTNVLQR